jgi:hypothetical protein
MTGTEGGPSEQLGLPEDSSSEAITRLKSQVYEGSPAVATLTEAPPNGFESLNAALTEAASRVDLIAEVLSEKLRPEIRVLLSTELGRWQVTAEGTFQAMHTQRVLPVIESLGRSTEALQYLTDLARVATEELSRGGRSLEHLRVLLQARVGELGQCLELARSALARQETQSNEFLERYGMQLAEMAATRREILDLETQLAKAVVPYGNEVKEASRKARVALWIGVATIFATSLAQWLGPLTTIRDRLEGIESRLQSLETPQRPTASQNRPPGTGSVASPIR